MTEFHDRIAIGTAVVLGFVGVAFGVVLDDVPRALAITAAGLPVALVVIAIGRQQRARAKAARVEAEAAERVLALTLDLLRTEVPGIDLRREEFRWTRAEEGGGTTEIRLAEVDDGQVVVAGRADDLSTVTVHVRPSQADPLGSTG